MDLSSRPLEEPGQAGSGHPAGGSASYNDNFLYGPPIQGVVQSWPSLTVSGLR